MRISIILTGYYFKYFELYRKILEETNLYSDLYFELYIVSHKTKEEIPNELFAYLIETNWQIIFQPNIGWDWGCHVQYMQWLEGQNAPKPDYLLFLHDDISIIKNGFIREFLNKANSGKELIGNSTPFTTINHFEKDYADEAFILKKNGFDYEPNKIEIVRGSALFLSHKLAQQTLKNLPSQKCGNINLANRSLRMFGAITTKLVGREKIGYLSEEHFKSDFITEEMRGGDIGSNFFLNRFIRTNISKLFYFTEKYFLSKLIYKHSYPFETSGLLKINIADKKILQGYLNLCLNDEFCSDISIEEFQMLLIENKVHRIVITSRIVFDDMNFLEIILSKIVKSSIPVDLFIDAENITKEAINKFRLQNHKLDIRIEKVPKLKGTKWVNRLFVQYPQQYLKPE